MITLIMIIIIIINRNNNNSNNDNNNILHITTYSYIYIYTCHQVWCCRTWLTHTSPGDSGSSRYVSGRGSTSRRAARRRRRAVEHGHYCIGRGCSADRHSHCFFRRSCTVCTGKAAPVSSHPSSLALGVGVDCCVSESFLLLRVIQPGVRLEPPPLPPPACTLTRPTRHTSTRVDTVSKYSLKGHYLL